MKRKTKNIIMISILILLLGGIFGTMLYAKNNLESTSESNMQMPNNQNMEENKESKETPSEKTNEENVNVNETSDNETPPEKPDENEDSEKTENNQTTPPDKPDETTQNNNDNIMQDNNFLNMNMESKTTLTTGYYIIFTILSSLISFDILYLIMSKFNKLLFKETFINFDKTLIFILSFIIVSTILVIGEKYLTEKVFLNNSSNDNNQMVNMNNNINNNSSASYTSVYEIVESKEISDESYISDNSNENAILASGDIDVSLDNITVNKTGDSDSGDNANFYGINSGVIAKDGASLTIKNSTITTNATGANAVFSYGGSATTNNSSSDGTLVTIENTKITTTKDSSGGIMTTGGGKMVAKDLEVNTSGTSSAAIRTDRGGGEVTVNGGTYETTGVGSPAIYSTASITVKNATLTSKASEGIIIEGKNSVNLNNVTLTDNNTKLNGQSTTYKNIFLYQSTSGDASEGTSEFVAKNSKITTSKGDTIYVTNTSANITLENNTFTNKDEDGYFLRIQKDSWGQSGSNGGDVTLSLTNENITGNIYVDEISTLDITMNKTTYKGIINGDNTAKQISLTIDKSSKITLNGNWYLTSFENEDTSNSNIDFNGFKIYVNGESIN